MSAEFVFQAPYVLKNCNFQFSVQKFVHNQLRKSICFNGKRIKEGINTSRCHDEWYANIRWFNDPRMGYKFDDRM